MVDQRMTNVGYGDEPEESEDMGDDSGYSSDKEDTDGLDTPDSDEMPTDFSSGENDEGSGTTPQRTLMPPPEDRKATAVSKSNFFLSVHRSSDQSSVTSSGSRNSISSTSLSLTDSDTSDDNKWNMRYLQKKRRLLRRASDYVNQEEAYEASIAKETAAAKFDDSPLWREAKEVVDVLFHEGKGNTSDAKGANPSALGQPRNSKRPRIDLSSVQHLYSQALNEGIILQTNCSKETHRKIFIPSTVYSGGKWMAKALGMVWNAASRDRGRAESEEGGAMWDILMDPHSGVVSTFHQNVTENNAISLEDAISCTPVAQLVTQSVPPFVVIHANRAFSVFSGLVSKDVIGRPVESIINVARENHKLVTEDSTGGNCSGLTQEKWHYAILKLNSSKNYNCCKIRVVPVMDTSSASNDGPKCPLRMAHVLVQIRSAAQCDAISMRNLFVDIAAYRGTDAKSKEDASSNAAALFGAIG